MSLFERLPEEDVIQLHRYLDSYGDEGNGVISRDRMDYFLRFWNENKEPFFRAFGEQFIVKKEIRFVKDSEELADEMYKALCCGDVVIREFISKYKRACQNIGDELNNWDMTCHMQYFVDNWEMLVDNVYTGPAFTIPAQFTKNGRPLVVNHNCKMVKMLGKIVEAIGAEMPIYYCSTCGCWYDEPRECCEGESVKTSGYELFRQAHSQVLNQKQIKGNLCLSIHPLDYLTMSDNDCGWTSCMSWMEEAGDYRLGTIEMMNSNCVVVAYIESHESMFVCGSNWNNKRWRQLYIVTREVILGNRQYPYDSDEIQGVTIRWLRELMGQVPGYGPYPEETIQLRNDSWNTVRDKKIHFHFYSGYMYNDIYDYRLAYVADQKIEDDEHYRVYFSGPAVCTGCGGEIELETVDASVVQCRACDGHWRCDFCGDWHPAYDDCYTVNDEYTACEWCYHNELQECEVCGDHHRNEDMVHVYIQIPSENREIIEGFNYNFYVSLCTNCLKDKEEYEALYGPIHEVIDDYGNTRHAFDLANITEDGFNTSDLSIRTVEWMKLMQAAKSDEERISLIEKIVY